MTTKVKLFNKIKKEFPDFIGKVTDGWYTFHYCCNWQIVELYKESEFYIQPIYGSGGDVVSIGLDKPLLDYVDRSLLNSNVPSDFEKLMKKEKADDVPLIFEIKNLSDNDINIIISGLRGWKNRCDSLRRGPDEDVIFVIHPDIDEEYLPDLIRDFKCVVEDDNDWKVGIINTRNWNFGNKEFCMFLYTNSGDSLDIQKADKDEVPDEILDKLKAVYPNIDNITKVYESDWD